ncbi:SPOR domain-containing protein [bacterium]|nr:SPOR domain-containing protein [bacterium]MBT3581352.1 SPOR domain-containing protein [bacterium]MBT4552085.1 SPOR domain-containing protein [bacterium]MBT5988215.1 SPOR domain-containing protein [bacterium]MBT7088243.1 SPOR domain-containing protein [bacterium]
MNKQNNILDDELEYNDGLGDMLREKESHEFSWTKTMTTSLAILVIVLLVLILIFSLGKKAFFSSEDQKQPITQTATITYSEIIEEEETLPTKEEIQQEISEIKSSLESIQAEEEKPTKAIVMAPTQAIKTTTPAKKTVAAVPQKAIYKVIAGTFSDYKNAKTFQKQLAKKQISSFIRNSNLKNKKLYQVQIGAFKTYQQASQHIKTIKRKGFSSYIIKSGT